MNKWKEYERRKKILKEECTDWKEYDREIAKLIKELKL